MFLDHFIPQPAAFIRRRALKKAGWLNDSLHFCMDYDLWLRIALVGRIEHIARDWACFRVHPASKGSHLQALRWVETAEILSTFFARPDVPSQWQRYREQAIGCAHWRAAIEFYKSQNGDQARNQVAQALDYSPPYLKSRDFAGRLVGGFAAQTTTEILDFVDGFFALIPDQVIFKRRAYQRARARAQALVALNPSTSRQLARENARRALRADPFWLSNRHVLSRALR